MKRCPNCMNINDSRFCPECGYDMSTVESLICPNCGNETTSRFCPNCGTKLLDSSESIEKRDSDESLNKEIVILPVTNNEPVPNSDNASSVPDFAVKRENSSPKEKLRDSLLKKPAVLGAIIAVLVIALIASIGSGKKPEDTSADVSTDSYSTVDDSSQEYDSTNDSDYSSSTTYSDTDDGLDIIQGTWELVGVITDGESTNVRGLTDSRLVINGDKWTMTISTGETTVNSGTLYFDVKSNLDSGDPFYVYTMRSDELSGSVKMAYSSQDNFIAVSTKETLDSENCMMFGR